VKWVRLAAVVALAACGSPAAPVVTPPQPRTVTADGGARGASPMAAVPATRAMINAPHGAPIAALALTPDGTAAITADESGGMRLWPKLDGTREPCVVELPSPRALAIAKHGSGFFIAWIDSAGSLSLAELDDRGRTTRRGAIPQDAEFLGLAVTDVGLLAWRSDHTIVLYDLDGVQLGRLGTEPGERLVNIAANGTNAVAVVAVRNDSGEANAIRPIQLAPALAWGQPFEAGGGNPLGPIAISKSGKRIALATSQDDKTREVRIVERTTGRLLAATPVEMPAELGFTDEDHVALGLSPGTGWLATTKGGPPVTTGSPSPPEQFATADHIAVTAAGFELQLARPDAAQFLGYGLTSPQVATLGPNHGLVIGMMKELVQLDATFATTQAKPPLLPADATLLDLQWLGESDFAANVMHADGVYQSLIVSSAGRDPLPVPPPSGVRMLQPLRYEPSTHVLTRSFGDASVARWHPDQRTLDVVASFARAAASHERQLVPLAPALAGGKELVDITILNGATVTWTDATTKQRSAAMPVTAFITADAAGHVYAWTVDPASRQLVISVLEPGKIASTLPHDGTVTLWPDPRGTRVAELGSNQVALYKLDGTLVWKQSVMNANKVLWPSDDSLAVISATGIARLDAATGAVTGARCGWSFGLRPTAHTASVRMEPLCTQLGP